MKLNLYIPDEVLVQFPGINFFRLARKAIDFMKHDPEPVSNYDFKWIVAKQRKTYFEGGPVVKNDKKLYPIFVSVNGYRTERGTFVLKASNKIDVSEAVSTPFRPTA